MKFIYFLLWRFCHNKFWFSNLPFLRFLWDSFLIRLFFAFLFAFSRIGLTLNPTMLGSVGGVIFKALAVNDGYMPVTSTACIYVEGHHIPMNGGARLPILCDWIFGTTSIGDLFFYLCFPLILIGYWCHKKENND